MSVLLTGCQYRITTSSATEAATLRLTVEEVKATALAHANINADYVWDLEVDFDKEWGISLYEVSFEADGLEYEYEIEAYTGEILRSKVKRDR